MKQMCRQRIDMRVCDAWGCPDRAEQDSRDRKPAPKPHARQREGRDGGDAAHDELAAARGVATVRDPSSPYVWLLAASEPGLA